MIAPDFSPAADRNKQAILDVLRQVLPPRGNALEVASGTGQHVAWFAAGLPLWTWQPTDVQPDAFGSMAACVAQQGLDNVHAPALLDVMSPHWLQLDQPAEPHLYAHFDAIVCTNMLHIAPWNTCAALMHGSARHLSPGGALITYGPFLEDDVPTSPSNTAFDQSLREHDPRWGIRRLEDVARVATRAGLQLTARYAMPANNLLLVWMVAG